MKKLTIVAALALLVYACAGNADKQASSGKEKAGESASAASSYDTARGAGKFTNVQIAAALDPKMAELGKKVYDLKCASCHKVSDEKLVGPGWKGVTSRHTAAWIMNFSTNPDEMLQKDPKAQAMLEICLVRMPNQNLSDDEARQVYEFMRKNDGIK
ncbi:MAG: c-type cytochrome [Pseudobacter sp.]|uniref:c-type cytochrome n=1 Tax=Pseudobacter sp. TaxID=2045420 RepID=UPI003F80D27B